MSGASERGKQKPTTFCEIRLWLLEASIGHRLQDRACHSPLRQLHRTRVCEQPHVGPTVLVLTVRAVYLPVADALGPIFAVMPHVHAVSLGIAFFRPVAATANASATVVRGSSRQ